MVILNCPSMFRLHWRPPLIRPRRSILVIASLAALLGLAGAAAADEVLDLTDAAPGDFEVGGGPEVENEPLRNLIIDAQRLLRLRGYDPGPVDGQFGWRTQRAIRAYQELARSRGYLEALEGPGVAGPEPAAPPPDELVRSEERPPIAVE
jgi:peptidoglycan hydrolase-like protein with peptidoglycan-binding domain